MNLKKPLSEKNLFHLAIVVSEFNAEITELLLAGALERLKERGFSEAYIAVIKVPGAVEIPLVAQLLARTDLYSAIICLGAVIQGETDHYRYVCEQVSQGCQQVALAHEIPVIFGVLTTQNEAQALARAGGAEGNKGREAVDAAVRMVEVLQKISDF